jgi:hypothetical protein
MMLGYILIFLELTFVKLYRYATKDILQDKKLLQGEVQFQT